MLITYTILTHNLLNVQ